MGHIYTVFVRDIGNWIWALDMNTLDFGVLGKRFYMNSFADPYSELDSRCLIIATIELGFFVRIGNSDILSRSFN